MRPYEYPPNPGLPGTKKGGVNIPTAPLREDAARAVARFFIPPAELEAWLRAYLPVRDDRTDDELDWADYAIHHLAYSYAEGVTMEEARERRSVKYGPVLGRRK